MTLWSKKSNFNPECWVYWPGYLCSEKNDEKTY